MEIRELQGYAYFLMTVVFVIGLYAYIVYLYRGKNRGEDYEKYSDLALKDTLDDELVEGRKEEEVSSKSDNKEGEGSKI
jgi:cytochrome c oxidase cbb3-type subunit 4